MSPWPLPLCVPHAHGMACADVGPLHVHAFYGPSARASHAQVRMNLHGMSSIASVQTVEEEQVVEEVRAWWLC